VTDDRAHELSDGMTGDPEHAVAHALADELDGYEPRDAVEAADLPRLQALASRADPWSRTTPVHVTGSAMVVHPATGRVLLRWHERMDSWLHVGGHVDPGESTALAAAVREGREETGLADLRPWPPTAGRPRPVHVAVVPVPAGRGEPAHEHADIRYVLATDRPDDATPESPTAVIRWLPIDEAIAAVGQDNLRETLARVRDLLVAANSTGTEPAPP
jgi:8-oxo-dGTP pyrophosphatase MutT (NUDIX family)